MKQTVKTSRAAGQLEKMFRTINEDLFEGQLEEPIITIQSTPRAYGHVTVNKAWFRGEETRHELNIGAETMARPIEELCATLIHEMCHLENIRLGIQDCSRGGAYHNKKFKDMAESKLLKIEHHDKYGWTITEPTEALLNYIIDKGWSELEMQRNVYMGYKNPTGGGKTGNGGNVTPPTSTPTKTKQSYRKHKCPCCGLIARTTKDAKLICGSCMIPMDIEY